MSTTRTTTMSTTRSTVFSGVTTSTTAAPSGSCCATVNCTSNADCCQRSLVECQCFRHSQTDTYGLCINPNATPACANNCPVQGRCKLDSDCCKCQCAAVTFTDSSGNKITRKQCVQR
ncbi:unnamed protein product [Adineta steineri]|uniref:Uncharacterized protein n=1 Tax=Adineta steineri TaxID=433720 RepID=A0A814XC01_9BILA|nr:unnamed protein product [Adineta steineri]CAF1106516.1 unnamed protein product [Adineta steineri]CAF1209205.1 unnamed protein product [Adineta steineri]